MRLFLVYDTAHGERKEVEVAEITDGELYVTVNNGWERWTIGNDDSVYFCNAAEGSYAVPVGNLIEFYSVTS